MYVYGFQKDSTGNFQQIFPIFYNTTLFSNPLAPGEFSIPSNNQGFILDDNAGEENFYIVYCENEIKNVDKNLNSLLAGEYKNAIINKTFSHLNIFYTVVGVEIFLDIRFLDNKNTIINPEVVLEKKHLKYYIDSSKSAYEIEFGEYKLTISHPVCKTKVIDNFIINKNQLPSLSF